MSLGCRPCHPVPRRILWPADPEHVETEGCSCLVDCGSEHCPEGVARVAVVQVPSVPQPRTDVAEQAAGVAS
jgi:hypothetical protein